MSTLKGQLQYKQTKRWKNFPTNIYIPSIRDFLGLGQSVQKSDVKKFVHKNKIITNSQARNKALCNTQKKKKFKNILEFLQQ